MKGHLAVLALSGCIVGSLAAGAAAYADAADGELGSTIVYFSHDELQGSAGIGRVYRRLDTAAHEVCQFYDSRELARQRAFQQCVAASLVRAVAQIHDPGLTAYHERRTAAIPALAAVMSRPATVR